MENDHCHLLRPSSPRTPHLLLTLQPRDIVFLPLSKPFISQPTPNFFIFVPPIKPGSESYVYLIGGPTLFMGVQASGMLPLQRGFLLT